MLKISIKPFYPNSMCYKTDRLVAVFKPYILNKVKKLETVDLSHSQVPKHPYLQKAAERTKQSQSAA